MNTTPSATTTGHAIPAEDSLTVEMRYTLGGGFASEEVSDIRLMLRFADNAQADVHIKLSHEITLRDFGAYHKRSVQPFEGQMAISARGDRLIIEAVYLCGYWHPVIC